MAVDLTIDPDTVRMIAERARAVSSGVSDDYESGHEHEVELDAEGLTDTHAHAGLAEEDTDNMTGEELTELIDDLNVDEAAELVAIAWIGRGDYEAGDWGQAVTDARERAVTRTSKYVTGMPLFADYLEAGLDALRV